MCGAATYVCLQFNCNFKQNWVDLTRVKMQPKTTLFQECPGMVAPNVTPGVWPYSIVIDLLILFNIIYPPGNQTWLAGKSPYLTRNILYKIYRIFHCHVWSSDGRYNQIPSPHPVASPTLLSWRIKSTRHPSSSRPDASKPNNPKGHPLGSPRESMEVTMMNQTYLIICDV